MMDRLLSWISKNKKEFWLILAILLAALIFRLWRIDEYLPFLGDEGRDLRVVRRFLTDFDLMFIGPRTSIGDMYLGPAYYYLVSPFLLLFGFSPTGPAVFVALTSTATVFLIWITSREWFGKAAAFSAAALYAVSPSVINLAKHSWNPNIMPFFALLSIWSIWRVWKHAEFKWLLVLGFSFAVSLQSHYLGLLLLPLLGVYWLLTFKEVKTEKKKIAAFLKYSVFSILIFTLLMFPLLLFDAKHDWLNFNSLKRFFLERQTTVSAKPWGALPFLEPFWREQLVGRLLTAGYVFGKTAWVSFSILALSLWVGYFWKKRKDVRLTAYTLLVIWFFTGAIGLGLLKQNIYEHYFGFLFPLPFLLVGAIVQGLFQRGLKIPAILLVVVLIWVNLQNNPLKNPPQRQVQRVQEINRQIIADSANEPFNFGLIAERNYEEGYLYFFELANAKVREINPLDTANTLTRQLYVVCEDLICEPINHRKAEIANFGWAKIEKQWEVEGKTVFKLIHTQ